MKKILITGANSFIGRYFKSHHPHYNIAELNLIDYELNQTDFVGFDVVYHVAAIVHQDKKIPDDIYYSVNRDLAVSAANYAKKAGVKQFVFMSTVKVYGENTTYARPWTEESLCLPQDAYGKSKLEAEKRLVELSGDNFTVSIVRTPVVYGQNVKGNIKRISQLIQHSPIVPFGAINNKRAMVYIGNLMALIEKVIDDNYNGIVLASDKRLLSTTEFVNILIESSSSKCININFPLFAQSLVRKIKPAFYNRLFGNMEIDNSITRKKLNFEPPFTVEQGLKTVIEHRKNK